MNSVFEKLKVQKSLLWSIKFLVFVFVCYYLLIQLQKISESELRNLSVENPTYIIIAFFLVFMNWGLEWLKWYLTVLRVGYSSPKRRILQSMLAGVSTGFVTPNRIGNFIGRMLYFPPRERALLVVGTLYGNLAQFVATVTFGLVGISFTANHVFEFDYSNILVVAALVFTTFSFIIYFLYPVVPLAYFTWFKRRSNLIRLFRGSAKKLCLPLFALSLLRYLVFILQFTLLLIGFGADYSHEMIYSLYVLYLASTLTPNLVLGKLVVRETLALIILGGIIINPAVVIAASFSLWLINLGFPALIGLLFFLRPKTTEE